MAIISGFAPGGSTSASISRVDSPHSGRSSGSGGSSGSMEEVKEGQDQDAGGGKSGESMSNPIPIVGGKRGVEYECESCNKKGWFKITISFFFVSIFFFVSPSKNQLTSNFVPDLPPPNCLNKHRWEYTRQWRKASKFVLSKYQQVQLLEAAAILSFMGKDPTSLPKDRSEWPTFLSAEGRESGSRGGCG